MRFRKKRRLFWALPLLICGLLGTEALADSYKAVLTRAAAARDRALETEQREDWLEAFDLFEAAVQLEPSKEAEFELGVAAFHLNLYDEAYEAYEVAWSLGLRGRAGAQAVAFLNDHAYVVTHLEIAGPPGTAVYVGARRRGSLPLRQPLVVMAGVARVRLEAQGFQLWEEDVTLTAGTTRHLNPPLTPLPEAHVDHPAWAGPTLIAGTALALTGAATAIATTLLLPGAQSSLSQNCTTPSEDGCAGTSAAMVGAAQSAADKIVTLKNLRWIGLGGALVGVSAATVGLLGLRNKPSTMTTGLLHDPRSGGQGCSSQPFRGPCSEFDVQVSDHGMVLEWTAAF